MRRPTFVLPLALASVLALPSAAQTAQTALTASAKRPMTFEDMMQMKRLGETAVSPDSRWLAYSVTTVNLDKNTKTARAVYPVRRGWRAKASPRGQPGDQRPAVLSRRQAHPLPEQPERLATGLGGRLQHVRRLDKQPEEADRDLDRSRQRPSGPPTATSWFLPPLSILTVRRSRPQTRRQATNATPDRDAALASSKVKAQVFTHLLYRHWDHFTGDKRSHLFLASVESGAVRDLTPNDPHDVPPAYPSIAQGCGCAFSPDSKELAFTENLDEEPATSVNADIFTLDLTDPAAKPEKVSTSPGGDFNPAYSPDGSYLAWRSQARAGYESDRFRLVLYDRKTKKIKDLLPATLDNWVEEFAWTPDSKSLLFTEDKRGETADLHYKPERRLS